MNTVKAPMLHENLEYMKTLRGLGNDLAYLAQMVEDTELNQCVLSVCNNTISKERSDNWSFHNERPSKHSTVLKATRMYANEFFDNIRYCSCKRGVWQSDDPIEQKYFDLELFEIEKNYCPCEKPTISKEELSSIKLIIERFAVHYRELCK
jgi:hypothetical protein